MSHSPNWKFLKLCWQLQNGDQLHHLKREKRQKLKAADAQYFQSQLNWLQQTGHSKNSWSPLQQRKMSSQLRSDNMTPTLELTSIAARAYKDMNAYNPYLHPTWMLRIRKQKYTEANTTKILPSLGCCYPFTFTLESFLNDSGISYQLQLNFNIGLDVKGKEYSFHRWKKADCCHMT